MTGRYATHGTEGQAQPGSRGRVLANRLGIVRVRDMQVAETAALLQLTDDLLGEITEDQRFTADDLCAWHQRWLGEVQVLRGMSTDRGEGELLEKLVDKLHHAASDLPGGSPQDAEIDALLAKMSDLLGAGGESLAEAVRQTELLLLKRDVFLRAGRSK